MSFIDDTLRVIPLPKVVKVRQTFDKHALENPSKILKKQLTGLDAFQSIKVGERIAITGGSRGIDCIDELTRVLCDMVKSKGAHPFIVPAMGSHGGATAEGQIEMLSTFGISRETMDVPIVSSMETTEIGCTSDNRPVYMDKNAYEADGVILINRVKAHTSFRGKYESGLMKMMAIGLGKQKGAQNYHQTGFKQLPLIIEEVGNIVLNTGKIRFGVALIENGYNKLNHVECIAPERIPEREAELLLQSYKTLPLPFFRNVDVMIIQEIGKNISGTGHDPNVTGRYNNEHFKGEIHTEKLGILNLCEASHGNANGVGMGDFITQKLFKAIDVEQTYPNSLTSTSAITSKIPIVLKNDLQVFQASIKTSCITDYTKVRLAILKNTKDLEFIYVTQNMMEEAECSGMEILTDPFDIKFNEEGNMVLDF